MIAEHLLVPPAVEASTLSRTYLTLPFLPSNPTAHGFMKRKQITPWAPSARNAQLEKALFSEKVTEGINFDKYDDIPVTVRGVDVPPPLESFKVRCSDSIVMFVD